MLTHRHTHAHKHNKDTHEKYDMKTLPFFPLISVSPGANVLSPWAIFSGTNIGVKVELTERQIVTKCCNRSLKHSP